METVLRIVRINLSVDEILEDLIDFNVRVNLSLDRDDFLLSEFNFSEFVIDKKYVGYRGFYGLFNCNT